MGNFINQLISVFFSEHCYEQFFMKFNFLDVECLKQTISKGLGAGIILGSTFVKIPQILKILGAKSSEGISFISVLLELLGVTSAASYSYSRGYPFSSWGESVFLLLETAIIGFLVLLYGGHSAQANLFAALYSVAAYSLFSGIVPSYFLWSMQIANVPIIVCAKMIQAWKNFENGHTGQLSAITVFLLFLGSCARIFTSIQETGDSVIIFTFIMASLSNGVLAAQVLYYWKATTQLISKEKKAI